MLGVSPLSAARGGLVSAPVQPDPPRRGSERLDVIESTVIDSVWALRTSWYEVEVHPRLDDWWWRRLDSFAVECDDPRILELIDRMRSHCRRDEQPFEFSPVVEPPASEIGIVELILSTERPWYETSIWERSNDLLVDVIRMQRSRW